MPALSRRLAVARGDEPADLVIRGSKVFSAFTREWLDGDLAVADGFVAGLGDYEGHEVLELSGRYLVPGFIDAHMHLESSKLLVDEFARLVLPLGTTAVVADPHEIANVLGPGDLEGLLRRTRVIGLAEMMNFPGVVSGADSELEKLALPGATHVDGHAPSVLGKALNAYAAAGIRSDHEMSTIEEGRERLRAGMWVLIREASGARNLHALLPLVAEFGPHRLAFCTDDREPEHIAEEGHVNSMVREAVAVGVKDDDMLRAVRRMADTGGGVVVVDQGIVKAELKLPIAGLLSDASLDEVIAQSRACVDAAQALGCRLPSPFQTMAFLALSVIPSLKITDRGLVDVDRFELVPLQA